MRTQDQVVVTQDDLDLGAGQVPPGPGCRTRSNPLDAVRHPGRRAGIAGFPARGQHQDPAAFPCRCPAQHGLATARHTILARARSAAILSWPRPAQYSSSAFQPADAYLGIQWSPRFSNSCFSAVNAAR